MDYPQSTTQEPTGSTADLASRVGCLSEQEVAALAGVKLSTLDAWRKRGKGPSYIRFGCNVLYPRQAVSEYLQSLVRERSLAPKGVL